MTPVADAVQEVEILLLDDDPQAAGELGRLLTGGRITTCRDAGQGLKIAESGDFSLILIDFLSADGPGWGLLEGLSRLAIPLLVLSAELGAEGKARALDLGAWDCLVKYPPQVELNARLRRCMRLSDQLGGGLALLPERISHGVLLVDGDSEIIETANEAACRLLGRSGGDLDGLSAQRLLSPDPAATSRAGKGLEQEWLVRRMDGKRVPVEVVEIPLFRRMRRVNLRILKDASEYRRMREAHKNSRKALRQSRELLESVLDNAQAVIFIKDINGRYMLVNRRFESLFFVSREEVKGRTDFDFFPREQAEIFRANDRSVLSSGQPLEVEERVPHEDGFRIYISLKFPLLDDKGKPFAVCGIATDITSRKRAEAALKESEERLRALLNHSPDLLLLVDREEVVLLCNQASPALVPDQPLLGRPLEESLPSSALEDYRRARDMVLQQGGTGRFSLALGVGGLWQGRLVPLGGEEGVHSLLLILTRVDP